MKLIEINWHPSGRQLRQFGIICLVVLPLLGWLWGGSVLVVSLLGVIGLGLAFAGIVFPKALLPVFVALTVVTAPIGMVIGELAMLMIYFGVFLPMGLLFRFSRRDALQLKLNRNSRTYWQPKKQPRGAESYYRQS